MGRMREVGRVIAMRVFLAKRGFVVIRTGDMSVWISKDESLQLGRLLVEASRMAGVRTLTKVRK